MSVSKLPEVTQLLSAGQASPPAEGRPTSAFHAELHRGGEQEGWFGPLKLREEWRNGGLVLGFELEGWDPML